MTFIRLANFVEVYSVNEDGEETPSYRYQNAAPGATINYDGSDFPYLSFIYQGAAKTRTGDNLQAALVLSTNEISQGIARKSRAADREPRSRLGAETPTRSDHSLGSGRLAETPLVRRRLVRTSHKEGSGRVTGSSHLGDLVGRQAHAAECVAGSRGAPRGEGSCGPGRKPC
jgi:hypothetical protein